ncbi:DnaJ domain-containing protein [Sphingomonadaceae bacterium G21617-S1]|uniref:J domain-containing protein n=1 Tax=Rhizorhabdus sp. TaxID=1968843 RepID=UPI00120F46A4|nr:DnaJ domain-containing protein [Rhizorhabdus sp.]MBD3762641.1 DnaJ domain-containing protein [Rhizorhabdus sp.]MCZ4341740.1 DnaJ domain-containing protein [Sphingomonadaceae bacterium G21617-S1]TAK10829.1 MAG: molecular chaperone DnaJ [Rhizorhabdus sp.]
MILLLLAAAGVAWWYWGRHLSRPQLIAAASALAGAFLALRGAWAVAIPLFLPGIWLLVQQQGLVGGAAPAMDSAEARRVLGVGPDADPEAIRAAHRRLVAKVHPDQGGSAELASRVNAARDILLAELARR